MNSKGFASVVSIDIAKELESRSMLGNYHLLLTHDTLKKSREYSDFYRALRMRDQMTHIIMDNSIIEEKKPRPPKDIAEAASIVIADAAVIPDKIDDMEETVRLAREFAPALKAELLYRAPYTKMLAVVQGVDEDECYECAKRLLAIPHVGYLSVPRGLTKNLKTRTKITARVAQLGAPIHLLGFSDDIHDDLLTAAQTQHVMGIDSAVPIRWGLQKQRLSSNSFVPARNPDWLDQDADFEQEVADNLGWVRFFLQHGHPPTPPQLDSMNQR